MLREAPEYKFQSIKYIKAPLAKGFPCHSRGKAKVSDLGSLHQSLSVPEKLFLWRFTWFTSSFSYLCFTFPSIPNSWKVYSHAHATHTQTHEYKHIHTAHTPHIHTLHTPLCLLTQLLCIFYNTTIRHTKCFTYILHKEWHFQERWFSPACLLLQASTIVSSTW